MSESEFKAHSPSIPFPDRSAFVTDPAAAVAAAAAAVPAASDDTVADGGGGAPKEETAAPALPKASASDNGEAH
jgi:hypothetical protein